MAVDLGSARHWARALQREALYTGAVAVDATVGNGHDTLFLCESVGPAGRVYGFDLQSAALESAQKRLDEAKLSQRAQLFHAGHERMLSYVSEPADLIVFNLGWLPGGDKSVTTMAETTLKALDGALNLLKPGGLLTVCVYPGHAEGAREALSVCDWAASLDGAKWQTLKKCYLNQPPAAPFLIAAARIK